MGKLIDVLIVIFEEGCGSLYKHLWKEALILVHWQRESEHAFPASPPDERPWCGECDGFIESSQEVWHCGIHSCRWVLHHNCVRPHYSRRHPLQPIPDGFEM